MDEIDIIILKKLMENSRVTYRELAEIVDMSISTIHKRINKLVDDGIIEAFTAQPNPIALNSLWILIFGTSKAKSMDLLSEELGQNENINFVGILGGKFLYISAYLRNISELQGVSIYVSRTANISKPTIGIINLPYISLPASLTSIDYKILKSINRDSRKAVIDIADDVGLSAKTVRKRLDRMIEENLATFSIEWTQKAELNLTTVFHIYLNEGTNIDSTIQYINEKYNQNVTYIMSYSNIPNLLTMVIWTKTVQTSHKIQEELQTEGFQDIIPHIFLSSKYYDCWIDHMLRTK